MAKAKHDWSTLDPLINNLKAQGWNDTQIAKDLRIGRQTLVDHLRSRDPGIPEVQHTREHQGTLEGHQEVMEDIQQSVPEAPRISTDAEQSADELFDEQDVEAQRPVQTPVHDSAPSLDTSAENSADDSADESQILFLPPTPAQTPVQRFDTGAVQTLDTGAVQRIDQLEDEVRTLAQMMRSVMDRLNQPPVQTPVQITTLPPYPKGKAVRWNIWILDAIQDELKTLAAERDVSPSQLVQELLWKALRQE
jgi:hypothetical protein